MNLSIIVFCALFCTLNMEATSSPETSVTSQLLDFTMASQHTKPQTACSAQWESKISDVSNSLFHFI
jgi:hypothetical protein